MGPTVRPELAVRCSGMSKCSRPYRITVATPHSYASPFVSPKTVIELVGLDAVWLGLDGFVTSEQVASYEESGLNPTWIVGGRASRVIEPSPGVPPTQDGGGNGELTASPSGEDVPPPSANGADPPDG